MIDDKNSKSQKPTACTDPIFLLGITPRSGTAYLSQLLNLHPDCSINEIFEDYFLYYSDMLINYARAVSRRWGTKWCEESNEAICNAIGNGLLTFLTSRIRDKGKSRLFAKTPSVCNLNFFFKFFPHAQLLILIRDGRAVAESYAKGFHCPLERVARYWAKGARAILEFDRNYKSSPFKYLILKYEDVFVNLESELTRIFQFLDLSTKRYDFEAAANLPIRGSSFFRGNETESVHWHPVKKLPNLPLSTVSITGVDFNTSDLIGSRANI